MRKKKSFSNHPRLRSPPQLADFAQSHLLLRMLWDVRFLVSGALALILSPCNAWMMPACRSIGLNKAGSQSCALVVHSDARLSLSRTILYSDKMAGNIEVNGKLDSTDELEDDDEDDLDLSQWLESIDVDEIDLDRDVDKLIASMSLGAMGKNKSGGKSGKEMHEEKTILYLRKKLGEHDYNYIFNPRNHWIGES